MALITQNADSVGKCGQELGAIAIRQHVRMQIGVAAPGPGDGKGESDDFFAVEGADDLSTDFLRDYEHAQRNKFEVGEVPNFLLQCHASSDFIELVTFSDQERIGGHSFAGSCCLACCHKDSNSSMPACCGARP